MSCCNIPNSYIFNSPYFAISCYLTNWTNPDYNIDCDKNNHNHFNMDEYSYYNHYNYDNPVCNKNDCHETNDYHKMNNCHQINDYHKINHQNNYNEIDYNEIDYNEIDYNEIKDINFTNNKIKNKNDLKNKIYYCRCCNKYKIKKNKKI